jgi:hypothetical protein
MAKTKSRPDRKGTRSLTMHTAPENFRHFKILVAETGGTTDALLHEALWLLFEHYQQTRPLPLQPQEHNKEIS